MIKHTNTFREELNEAVYLIQASVDQFNDEPARLYTTGHDIAVDRILDILKSKIPEKYNTVIERDMTSPSDTYDVGYNQAISDVLQALGLDDE